ncbi:uncharacterized protein LOC107046764 [Diachasma alloeum]|uniref:uncharacterized protein LOC107046764 n=1 Tax=Diachasma alloeum TaxID=454923 RepID=UPI00073822BE|nr:uncharacterized protein LOC107046764 [Diachasma alloeum]
MGKHKKKRHAERDEKEEILRKIQKLNDQVQRLFSEQSNVNKDSSPLVLDTPTVPDANILGDKPPSTSSPVIFEEISPDLIDLESSQLDELDSELLEVLGADPSKPVETEIFFQNDLEARWSFWLTSKVQQEVLTKMMDRYPRSSSKCLFEAPKLNPEIASISTDALTQRDKKFCASQNLTGSALVALGAAISSLLAEEIDKLDLLQKLCDAGKMMTQIHFGFSTTRRAFISPSLNKQVRSALEETTPDQMLYGSNLSDKVKEFKTLSKLGQELKIPPALPKKQSSLNPKSSFVRFRKQMGQKPQTSSKSSSSSFNRRKFPKRNSNPQQTSSAESSNTHENKKPW